MLTRSRLLRLAVFRPYTIVRAFGSNAAATSHDDHDHHDDHGHGHGHHHRVYDWRDDHSLNPLYDEDIHHRGVPDPRDYEYPFVGEGRPQPLSHPANYDPKNLAVNLVNVKRVEPLTNMLRAPETDMPADIAHECDYESEDLDFQPESFKTQHFRKKGQLWMWAIVGWMLPIFVACEFFLQKFPDEDYWRYQRAPPLNFPDEEDTPDTEAYKMFQSKEYKQLYEAGLLVPPYFKIENNQKIYSKWAGVNEPMPLI